VLAALALMGFGAIECPLFKTIYSDLALPSTTALINSKS